MCRRVPSHLGLQHPQSPRALTAVSARRLKNGHSPVPGRSAQNAAKKHQKNPSTPWTEEFWFSEQFTLWKPVSVVPSLAPVVAQRWASQQPPRTAPGPRNFGFLNSLHYGSLSLLCNCTQHSVDEPTNLRHFTHKSEELLELLHMITGTLPTTTRISTVFCTICTVCTTSKEHREQPLCR